MNRDLKKFQALSGIRTQDLCDAGAVLSQLSYQSHKRAVVYGLALSMGTFTYFHLYCTWAKSPLSCGFDSSVGRTLHRHRRSRGFEYRSEPEIFPDLYSYSVTAALASMTVNSLVLIITSPAFVLILYSKTREVLDFGLFTAGFRQRL